MIVRGAFNHLLRPGLRQDFRDGYDQFPPEYSMFLREGNQERAEVEATALSGLPRMTTRGAVEPIPLIDPVLSDKVVFVDDEFALGFAVSKKMMEDDLYNRAEQHAKWLGRSARLTQEYKAAALLDDAFSGSTFTGLLGESLISTTHSLLNGAGTWSNQVSGNPQLSVTGLQAMFELAEQQVDHQGDPIPARLDTLFVNVADEFMAIQLTQSEFEPFTADNQVNAVRRKNQGLNYEVSHYKSQAGNDWFGRDSDLHDAWFLFRVRPEFEDDFDIRTKAAIFTGRQRINVYFYDQRGWFGSNAA